MRKETQALLSEGMGGIWDTILVTGQGVGSDSQWLYWG